ncbi:MAG TPA: bifunctional diaminohydroxyphosphoribosylaminopyrimidine deaminase/5-amino-6-(5-phosphoribosylamino)uracil reductase RibD [Beijerinckiaceae bacterium]|nr:bifunctional diaminohydroxyphosphoribosylaminopyrimidine deaminase/5-amino-6-(5-phosphoribosylamino)uracil reductase RibD [Beijerinckiaceae bacterium]
MTFGTAPQASASALRPDDERLMRLALALGQRHVGLTWPNPSVGALVVDESDGAPRVVAQGITQRAGRPHAERIALDAAGAAARGATLYVSLEPCAHTGKTPPCVDAVITGGVARVVTSIEDPDPRVSGKGHAALRAAGVEVVTGVLADEARRANQGHILRVTRGRPMVTLKLARTADGFAAGATGPRLMITGPAANARVHMMRAHADAIMVGAGTIAADDPLLSVRLPGLEQRSPVRVVVDSALRTSPTAAVVAGAGENPTWIVTADNAPIEAERRLADQGAEVLRVRGDGEVDLAAALAHLAQRGITRVFCEGGPALADALAAAGLIDEVVLATAQGSLGGSGLPALGANLEVALASRFRLVATEQAGPDRLDFYEAA